MKLMDIAIAAKKEARCLRRKVGCTIFDGDKFISVANGSVVGNCKDGDCLRCKEEKYNLRFDICQCAHAEEVAIVKAYQAGLDLNNSSMYITLQPCYACLRLIVLSGIKYVVYMDPISFPDIAIEKQYYQIVSKAKIDFQKYIESGTELLELAALKQKKFLLEHDGKHEWEKHNLIEESKEEIADLWNYTKARQNGDSNYEDIFNKLSELWVMISEVKSGNS